MATIKTVTVQASLGEGLRIHSQIGNHTMYIDQPQELGGTDAGPTPLEYSLFCAAGCIASIARIMANQKKITLRSMEVTVQGDLDLDVLLGKAADNRPGFEAINMQVRIDADMSREQKEQFLHEVHARCPVTDNIAKTTPVSVTLAE